MYTKSARRCFRASILHFTDSPLVVNRVDECYEYIEDGLLVVTDGSVEAILPFSEYDPLIHSDITDYRGMLITPGLIDAHTHYPQTEMIASFGEQLLEWLNIYTFPTEKQFSNKAYASEVAGFFLGELLKNGTTTASVFTTVFPQSTDAFFEQARLRNMRMIAGKVMMDRNAPDYLCEETQSSYSRTVELIEKWHGKGRLSYAVTPRFAPTCSGAQLEIAGRLLKAYPGVYLHTHLAENLDEVSWVHELFPEFKSYFDVYDHFGLTGNRSLFAHAIHLSDKEWEKMADSRSVALFCPSSNLFLGSGLFDFRKAKALNIPVALGSDIGAGTSFSLLRVLSEAYKVCQLQGYALSAFKAFYLVTLGNARALSLDSMIGNFETGKEADFVVWKWADSDLQKLHQKQASTLEEKLFSLMMLGDERNVEATYIAGDRAYSSNQTPS